MFVKPVTHHGAPCQRVSERGDGGYGNGQRAHPPDPPSEDLCVVEVPERFALRCCNAEELAQWIPTLLYFVDHDDLINCNVATGERPRSSRNRQEIMAISSEQVRVLLTAAQDARNEALYAVAVPTGLHQGELLGLKWTDVDLAYRRLSVRRTLKATDHGLNFGPPKNKASRRSVPLSKTAVAFLHAHRTRQNEERLRLGDPWQDHDLVSPNRVGMPLDHNNLYYREYKGLLQMAGLEDEGFTFHNLRHTFATELSNQRKRSKIIQSLLENSSIVQTIDNYSHLLEYVDDGEVGLPEIRLHDLRHTWRSFC